MTHGFWRRLVAVSFAVLFAVAPALRAEEPASKTRNLVLITTDGLRPEEVFQGAEEALLSKKPGGAAHPEALRATYWRDTPEARREVLMPFLWRVVARQGQIFGNVDKGSPAKVTNGRNFSYPGYNELLTGAADDRIDSNDKKPNPNVNVLEWLNGKPAFQGRVAAFTSWDVFPFILNRERGGLFVNAAWEPLPSGPDGLWPTQELLNRLMAETPRMWDGVRYDSLTFAAMLEHLKREKPRVLYVSLGETDEFAHEGRYDLYLEAAHRVDAFLERLWTTLQDMPEYRGSTSLVVSTDHGRGGLPDGWRSHGAKVPGAEKIWIAVIGPDTPALGERSEVEAVTQSQIAATVAALLGEDYVADNPKAAPPIAEVLRLSQP